MQKKSQAEKGLAMFISLTTAQIAKFCSDLAEECLRSVQSSTKKQSVEPAAHQQKDEIQIVTPKQKNSDIKSQKSIEEHKPAEQKKENEKKPLSAYFLFYSDKKAELKKKVEGERQISQFAKTTAQEWNNLSSKQRRQYEMLSQNLNKPQQETNNFNESDQPLKKKKKKNKKNKSHSRKDVRSQHNNLNSLKQSVFQSSSSTSSSGLP